MAMRGSEVVTGGVVGRVGGRAGGSAEPRAPVAGVRAAVSAAVAGGSLDREGLPVAGVSRWRVGAL